MFGSRFRNKLSHKETAEGQAKREKIINDAQAMERLAANPDYQRLCELLNHDREGLVLTLLGDDLGKMLEHDQNIRLKARIHQIDRVLNKPNSLVWQMKNLTEVRGAIKEQTRVRQAHGTKTGGK